MAGRWLGRRVAEVGSVGGGPILEFLERRLLLAASFDLDGDMLIGRGDDAIFSAAWQAEGGYSFSPSPAQPGNGAGWDHRTDFDGDFSVDSADYAWLSTNWGLSVTDPLRYPDDPHDEDERADEAYARGAFPQNTWFSEQYAGMAVAGDDDWFRIDVPASQPMVSIDCRFLHAEGNLDVGLYDGGRPIAEAVSRTDNESLAYVVADGGTYYLRVYSPADPSGQRYDLSWDAAPVPDAHEQDDTPGEADLLGAFPEETWFSDVYGHQGKQGDEDYFAIDVSAARPYLTVDATFSHLRGDVNLGVWSQDLRLMVATSTTTTDNEHIEIDLAAAGHGPGRYYAIVAGPNSRQLYDFRWDAKDVGLRAVDDTATVEEDSTDNQLDVLANDVGSQLVVFGTSSGWTDGQYVYYSPPADRTGEAWIRYTIKGPGGQTDTGQVVVTIRPRPDDPVAADDFLHVPEDSVDNQLYVLANDHDPDGDSLTILGATITTAPRLGSLWHDGDHIYYTPNGDANGPETIRYTVDDGTGRTDMATATVTIHGSPDDPVAQNDFFSFPTGPQANTLHVTGNDYDPDGNGFTIVGFPALPDYGDVSTDGFLVEYEPDGNFVGFDSFDYTIRDTTGRTATATVNMHLMPASDIHEDDDTLAQAADLGPAEKLLFPCHLLDEDYYMVELPVGAADRVVAEMWFGHNLGNLELELLDANGTVIAGAYSTSDDEFLSVEAPDISPGVYYFRVFQTGGTYFGQQYLLMWNSFGSADPHEPDDSRWLADGLGATPSDVTIAGVSNDQDYYRIEIAPGMGYLTAECDYDRSEGNVDLQLYNSFGHLVKSSSSIYSHEEIRTTLAAGTYYLRVHNEEAYTGQAYELTWRAWPTEDPHEEDDSLAEADAADYYWPDALFRDQYGREATQTDDDYFRIDARSGFLELNVSCLFEDADGDIDMHLLDGSGAVVASGVADTKRENIEYVAPAPGPYYIRVTTNGPRSGLQTYELVWWEHQSDDSHEPDNFTHKADDKGPFPAETWHAGTLWNDDYYAIDVPVGHYNVQIDCRFTHAEGNINLEVAGQYATSIDDDEWLDFTVGAAGRYYLDVYSMSGFEGQYYELWWRALPTDDAHEPDGWRGEADAQGPHPPNDPFKGQLWDDDVFRIEVPQGYEHVTVDCTFDSAEGDIDIQLADAGGFPVDVSMGLSDGEHIDTVVPADGAYYIYLYKGAVPAYTGQQYELTWSVSQTDDNHENDNTAALADQSWDLPEGVWFDGRSWNNDYYRVTVPEGYYRLTADCLFSDAEGNITLVLYDEDEGVVDLGNSGTDDEHVDAIVQPGVYYVKVQAAGQTDGQEYELRWNLRDDDAHEQDDTPAQAAGKGSLPAGVETTGISQDDDYYQITVYPDELRIWATCEFSDAEGDLDLFLHNEAGGILAYSIGDGDREEISRDVSSAGTYYLRVQEAGDGTGQLYDLQWHRAPAGESNWTVMTYMDADNNLEADVQSIINDMIAADMPASLPVTVLVDGFDGAWLEYSTTRRGVVGQPLTDLGELNMGDPQTLADFIDWSMQQYPAEHYVLMLMDHGAGWPGCCTDDTSGDGLSMQEIQQVLADVPKLDIVLHVACMMGTVATAWQLAGEAEYVIASEANMAYPGMPMTAWLGELKADPEITPWALVQKGDEVYEDYHLAVGKNNRTLSTVQPDAMGPLVVALDGFADAAIASAAAADWQIIENARDTCRSYGSYRDIGDWMGLLTGEAALNASIRSAAQAVLDELPDSIVTNYYGPDVYGTGLTVYAPDGDVRADFDNSLFFVHDTSWRDFLLAWQAAGVSATAPAGPDSPPAGPTGGNEPRPSASTFEAPTATDPASVSPTADVPSITLTGGLLLRGMMDVECVVLEAPSRSDVCSALPTGLDNVLESDTAYVEVWVRNKTQPGGGIVGGYVELTYDRRTLTAQAASNGGLYTNFAIAAISPTAGSVRLGGMADLGVVDLGDDEWVRLGFVRFAADTLGTTALTASAGIDAFARAGEGAISPAKIEWNAPPVSLNVVQPASVAVDLQWGSDTGESDRDNVTGDNTPTYDVTVNHAGTIRIDYDGDRVSDVVQFVPSAGTYEFTPTLALPDGDFADCPVITSFLALGIGSATDRDPTAIDTVAPRVTVVAISSTDHGWSGGVVDSASWAFGQGGEFLPWGLVDQIVFRSGEPLVAGPTDLMLTGQAAGRVRVDHVQGSGSRQLVFTMAGAADGYLTGDRYDVRLLDSAADLAGNRLDGDGDGQPGGDHSRGLYVPIPGDANTDDVVDHLDYLTLKRNWGLVLGGTWPHADFDANGKVAYPDYEAARDHFGQSLPAPPPAAPEAAPEADESTPPSASSSGALADALRSPQPRLVAAASSPTATTADPAETTPAAAPALLSVLSVASVPPTRLQAAGIRAEADPAVGRVGGVEADATTDLSEEGSVGSPLLDVLSIARLLRGRDELLSEPRSGSGG